MSNTPKLRFPEFSGEWEEKTFGDILSLNMVPVEKPDTEYERLGILCHNKGTFHEHITDPSYIALDTLYKVHKHNFIVNITFAWEHAIAITTEKDEDALVTFRFLMFTFNNGYYYQFFKYAFSKEKFRYDLSVASPGGAGRNRVLNQKQLNKIPLIVPPKTEQQKIADFLSNVDSIIATETKILNALQKKKKALMQKLFTQQLRFKSDDGTDFPDWEESTLEKECEYVDYRGKTPKKVSTGIFLITAKNIKLGYIDYECSKEFIAENDFNEVMHRGKAKLGDVLITTEAPCGNVAQIDNENVALAQRVIKYSSKGRLNNTFLKYYFLSDIFRTIINEKSTGSTVKGIKGSVLHKQKVVIPSLEEQQKIADSLSSMDSLIQTQQKIVTTWQQRKKALLQKMFI